VSESLNVETTFGVGDKFSTRANRTAAMNAASLLSAVSLRLIRPRFHGKVLANKKQNYGRLALRGSDSRDGAQDATYISHRKLSQISRLQAGARLI
jgi:hypothetical protein